MTQDLIETVEAGIATLTMNRPEARNAFSREMMDALSEALPRLALDPAVRLVVLTGAGNAFSAGGDVKGFAKNVGGAPVSVSFDTKVTDLRARMEVSTLAARDAQADAGGDPGPGGRRRVVRGAGLRPAHRRHEAKLTTAFSKIGLSGDFRRQLLPEPSGRRGQGAGAVLHRPGDQRRGGAAHRHGQPRSARRAAARGGRAWAAELAALPTVAVGYMKRNLNAGLRGSLSDVLDAEALHMIRTFETDDHKGAAVAFVEKRPPSFNGR